jgi:hypothetical protein
LSRVYAIGAHMYGLVAIQIAIRRTLCKSDKKNVCVLWLETRNYFDRANINRVAL